MANPAVYGLRLSVLVGLYRQRWKYHAVSELFAGIGIALGVALFFGVLVANGSVLDATRQTINSVDGSATLKLSGRSSSGFTEEIAERASKLPGVKIAPWLLRQSAVIEGPDGRETIQLVGVTPNLIRLHGSATRYIGAGAGIIAGGIGLPSGVATSIGTQVEGPVTLLINGTAHKTVVRGVLDSGEIGTLASSGIAIALLPQAQVFAGERGRVNEVLVSPAPGMGQQVARELRGLAAGRLNVLPAEAELGLLDATAQPINNTTTLFAAISLMVGFLLALNAMLLTMPQRRRQFAQMRTQGYDSKQVLVILTFQAVALGIMSSLVGVAVGVALARTIFREAPIYLSVAFAVNGHQEIHLSTVLIAFGAGIVATLAASLGPVIPDLRSKGPVDAVLHRSGEPGQAITRATRRTLAITGAVVVLATTIAVLAVPALTVVGGITLALSTFLFIPLLFYGATRAVRWFAEKVHGGMVAVAVIELEAATTRTVVLAGIAALAVYGSTAVGGARDDLIRGLDDATAQFFDTADIWVTVPTNDLGTTSFAPDQLSQTIAREPSVASVRTYQGGLLDLGTRRVWLRARPPDDPSMLQASQIVEGNLATGAARLRSGGGWVALSKNLAEERGVRVGGSFTLPTPSGPERFRAAVVTTNVGWPPGAITLNDDDYRRYWQTNNPAALEITLKPGVTPAVGKLAVEQALHNTPALRVQTAAQRITQFENNARQGLRSLQQISRLLLLIAALALAAALSTAIYQRRRRLVSMKEDGYDRRRLFRGMLIESAVILGVGCLDGVVLGLYGHALANRYLRLSTGFPAPFSVGALQIALTLLTIGGITLAVVGRVGYSAAGVSTQLSYRE